MADGGNSDSLKRGENPPFIRELVKDFCSYTTTHGVGRLAEAKTIFSRLIWTIFILGAFAMFIYQIHGLFSLYLSRPVATVVKVKHKTEVAFPAVTICNLNSIKETEIPDNYFDAIEKEIKEWESDTGVPSAGPAEESPDGPAEENPTSDGDDNMGNNGTDDESYDPAKDLELSYLVENVLLSKLAMENDSKLLQMGHKFDDFVFDCNYRGMDCRNYSKHWNYFWDYRYGNCFTFNGGFDDEGMNQTRFDSHSTGPSGGLKLNLFIEINEYVPELSHSAGARIVIHDQGEMPFPDDEGLNLVPGSSTSVGVRREIIQRVDPFENGSCMHSNKEGKDTLYSKKFRASYSKEACMRSCLAKAQVKSCGCAEARFPIDDGFVCNTVKSRTTGKCLEDLVTQFNDHALSCDTDCPVPCREVVFKTSMSMAEWPSHWYKDILFKRVEKRNQSAYQIQLDDGPDFLHKNFLQARVFFERLNYQEVKEQLSYKGVNLVADIGGQLGLWIGVSVLTCCEVLELVLLMIQTVFKRVALRNSSRVEVRPSTNA